jgi:Mg2+-importing ATPase
MVFVGPTSSVFDIVTFIVMWSVFGATTPGHQALFQSGWFIESLLTQTLIVHMIRTARVPFLQSRAATPVLLLTSFIMLVGVLLPFSRVGAKLALIPLPGSYFFWLVAILLSYSLLTQLVKTWYIQRFHTWL